MPFQRVTETCRAVKRKTAGAGALGSPGRTGRKSESQKLTCRVIPLLNLERTKSDVGRYRRGRGLPGKGWRQNPAPGAVLFLDWLMVPHGYDGDETAQKDARLRPMFPSLRCTGPVRTIMATSCEYKLFTDKCFKRKHASEPCSPPSCGQAASAPEAAPVPVHPLPTSRGRASGSPTWMAPGHPGLATGCRAATWTQMASQKTSLQALRRAVPGPVHPAGP